MRPLLLVVDDEPNMLWLFEQSIGQRYRIRGARSASEARRELRRALPDLVLLDLRLPDADGLVLLTELRNAHPHLPVIVMTAYASVQTAVEAMKLGACTYLSKPFTLQELQSAIQEALAGARAGGAHAYPVAAAGAGRADILGNSPATVALRETVARIAPTDAHVLIQGESGAGKEVVARAIHALSRRAGGPFVAVNCAALPEQLLESELFGHEKGAFTGATANRTGLFEQAHRGTLLLDEIGDMPLPLQAKLLRVIEEKVVCPLGSSRCRPVDVRILAATHRDLLREVRRGAFREDLYFRLAVVPVRVPSLRERPEDIPVLARHFLREFSSRYRKMFRDLDPAALAALMSYPWPGNVRELRNLMEQVAVLWDGDRVELRHLPDTFRPQGSGVTAGENVPLPRLSKRVRTEFERERILEALRLHGGNRTRAALHLGLSRRALQIKLRTLREAGLLPADLPPDAAKDG
ncbi:sigma-54-dependent transcriptional regulator [Caldinitratiruptor microaerophilus]|uniref:Stage 0 sporulation protein A homolog n=1 Tax=Caldinitratiruptor microaerophilus TaxID=671077 RepID=A0AA35G9L1_9FIRM|nr:sigma-54 dependent transcriptional regulator [Caldinitratiruptor microaerophilus]BDG62315.1 acetoacetate metabolism regulatory protein AtoC [Caldinitratiruptor microaerophilus]